MSIEAAVQQDTATVWTAPDGTPQRLIWAGRRFQVVDKPIAWMGRCSWWEAPTRVPVGAGSQSVERPMWQVTAKALDNGELQRL